MSSCSNAVVKRKIDSVRIYSVGWNSEFLVAQTPTAVVSNPRAVVIDSISQDLASELQTGIQAFVPIKANTAYFDCRISCLLFSNGIVDTLSFSNNRVMQYNAGLYEEDSVLLWQIARELPEYQYQQLEIGRAIQSRNDNEKNMMDDTLLLWKQDSNGCQQLRNPEVFNYLINKYRNDIYDKEGILKIFGTPNRIVFFDSRTTKDTSYYNVMHLYYYWGTVCNNQGMITPNSDICWFDFEILPQNDSTLGFIYFCQ